MAGEQVSPAAASAPAAVSSPLSSPAPAPSAPAPSDSPAAAASDPTPASPATTAPTTPDPAARPEGLADRWWDSEKNALKVDPAQLIERDKEFDRLSAAEAAENVRKGTLPQKADDYKIDLPADFKAPVGVEFKFEANDPILAQARELAHAQGMTQDGFSKFLGLYAAAKVGEQAQINSAREAEIGKLGPTASARVDSVVQWLTGMDATADKSDARALAGMLVTAKHVEAFERIITRTATQGSASFSQSHRVPADSKEIPGFDNMSFEQKRQAQDQLARRSA